MRQVNSGLLHCCSCLWRLLLWLRLSWLSLGDFLNSRGPFLLSLLRLSTRHRLCVHLSHHLLHHLHRIHWPLNVIIRALFYVNCHVHLWKHVLNVWTSGASHSLSHLVDHIHDILTSTGTSHISEETSKIWHTRHTLWHTTRHTSHTTGHATLWRRLVCLRLRLRLIFDQMNGLLIFSDCTTKY